MLTASCPPASLTIGLASGGTIAWRMRGALYLTAVVKATFILVPGGRVCVTSPDPVFAEEQAGEVAPYLSYPEVSLVGHAEVPADFAQPNWKAHFALMRGSSALVRKSVDLAVSRAVTPRRLIRLDEMAPHPWSAPPLRRSGMVHYLPDSLPPECFQTAPPDQRVDAFKPDDILVLEGMIAEHPSLRTQLAAMAGCAKIYRRADETPRAGAPVVLRADTLQIHVDRLRCSILWRGYVKVKDEEDLASLRVVTALEEAAKSVAWVDPFLTDEETCDAKDSMANTVWNPSSTAMLRPDGLEKLVAGLSVPPASSQATVMLPGNSPPTVMLPSTPPPASFRKEASAAPGTVFASPELAALMSQAEALVSTEKPVGTVFATPDLAALMAQAEALMPGTMAISEKELERISAAPATPFSFAAPAAPSVPGTMVLSEAELEEVASKANLPFQKTAATPEIARPSPAPVESSPAARASSGTIPLSLGQIQKIAEKAALPFEGAQDVVERPGVAKAAQQGLVQHAPEPVAESAPPELLVVSKPHDGAAEGLGAAFLAAMAKAGDYQVR